MIAPRWLIFLLCSLLIAPVHAATETPWYEIELIAFARNAEDGGQSENWPQEPGSPDWSTAHAIQTELPSSLEARTQDVATPPSSFILVPEAGYQLSGATRQLKRTAGRMEPLLHLAWRQPVQNRDSAEPVYIQSPSYIQASTGYPQPSRLEGTVKISLSRYLHVDLDLLLREQIAAHDPSSQPSLGSYTTATSNYRSYRMQDHRRMRSNELHYIDHPLMGVLVEIRPFEAPEPKPAPPSAPIPLPKTAAPTTEPTAIPSGISQPATPSQ